jgi:U2-associated protein SR140
MFVDGAWWIPPEHIPESQELPSDPDDEGDLHSTKIKGFLGQLGQRRFLWLLRAVDFRRGSIARAMAFAMDHADAADEVSPKWIWVM